MVIALAPYQVGVVIARAPYHVESSAKSIARQRPRRALPTCVLGEAVEQAPRGLGVEEAHGQAHHAPQQSLLQQARHAGAWVLAPTPSYTTAPGRKVCTHPSRALGGGNSGRRLFPTPCIPCLLKHAVFITSYVGTPGAAGAVHQNMAL